MSCCGVCGGQKTEQTNEQDKNKLQEQTQESSQTQDQESSQTQDQEKKSLFNSIISQLKR